MMKKIISISIFIIFSINVSISQNLKFQPNNEEFSREFLRLVDSARTAEYGVRLVDHFDKSQKKWIVIKTPFENIIDSAASLACAHNNRHFYNFVAHQHMDPLIIGHINRPEIDGKAYTGSDTILRSFVDRCKYYTGESFFVYGECVWGGYTTYVKYKNLNSAELAKHAFDIFMKSKEGHREILLNTSHTALGIDLMIDPEFKRFYITVVTGNIKKAKI
jgi:hypothetical protein